MGEQEKKRRFIGDMNRTEAEGDLGEIGKNTLLLNRRFGPRLLLGGVVTASPAPEAGTSGTLLCTGCGACTRACPEGAIGPDGVDAFRCRTVRAWVPSPVVPAAKWLLRRRFLLGGIAPVIARAATIRCSLCVTGCPVFAGAAKRDEAQGPSCRTG